MSEIAVEATEVPAQLPPTSACAVLAQARWAHPAAGLSEAKLFAADQIHATVAP